ncbi:MAG: DUF2868 domain-containing protein, partial [Planctomycetales bacterium]
MDSFQTTDNEEATFAQSLCVQAVRIVERDGLLKDPEVDFELATNSPRDRGKLANPRQVIARRAELLLPRHTSLSKWGIELFLWFALLPLLGTCFFAFQFAGGWIASFFVLGEHEINVAGYVCFLVIQTALLVLACLFMLPPVFWGWLPILGRYLPLMGIGGMVGAATKIAARLTPTRWLNRSAPEEQAASDDWRNTAMLLPKALDALVFKQLGVMGALSAFLSHLFWLILGIWVLLVLGGKMFMEQYDFRWRSTILHPDTLHRFVELCGEPMEFLVESPSEADVLWLMDVKPRGDAHGQENHDSDNEKTSDEKQKHHEEPSADENHVSLVGLDSVERSVDVSSRVALTSSRATAFADAVKHPKKHAGKPSANQSHPRGSDADVRARWGWFLLFAQLGYAVLPRGFFFVLSLFLVKRSMRKGYSPDLNDPYFKSVLEHIEQGELETETAGDSNEDEDEGKDEDEDKGPLEEEASIEKPSNEATPATDESSSEQSKEIEKTNTAEPTADEQPTEDAATVKPDDQSDPEPVAELPPQPEPKPDPTATVMFSYEVAEPPKEWKALLGMSGDV